MKNNLPDVAARWLERDGSEMQRTRTQQSFCIPKAEIAAQGYDLRANRYRELVQGEVKHRDPKEILKDVATLEDEIRQGIIQLTAML